LGVQEFNPVSLLITRLSQLFVGQPDEFLQVFLSKDVSLDSVNNKALYLVLWKKWRLTQAPTSSPTLNFSITEK